MILHRNVPRLVVVMDQDADEAWSKAKRTSRVVASSRSDGDRVPDAEDRVLARHSILDAAFTEGHEDREDARNTLAHEIGHLLGYEHPRADSWKGTVKAFLHAVFKARFGLMVWNQRFCLRRKPLDVWAWYEVIEPIWRKQWANGLLEAWGVTHARRAA